MSEALADEIEAINSIYGADTLTRSSTDPSGDIFILTLPGDAAGSASLRLQFPPTYPDVPPILLGTYSSGSSGKRGTAARDLALFRDAVSEVYQPGQVCLFDAIEKVQELLSSATETDGAGGGAGGGGAGDHEEPPESDKHPGNIPDHRHQQPPSSAVATPKEEEEKEEGEAGSLGPEPPWTLSPAITESKSTFLARCAPVTSPSQATSYLAHLLATDKRVRAATHNITAWRIRGPNGTSYQDCDDDGETAAGGRLLHLMQLMDLWDVMVVVTRWYGGVKLGPKRFALINQAAREAFVRAGLVKEEGVGGGGAGKKKGR